MRIVLISCILREIKYVAEFRQLFFARNRRSQLPSRNSWLNHAEPISQIFLAKRVSHTSVSQAQAKEFG